jgi:hypothetical protein
MELKMSGKWTIDLWPWGHEQLSNKCQQYFSWPVQHTRKHSRLEQSQLEGFWECL